MALYLLKFVITSVMVVLISEVAKRSSLAGGILASIPLTSVLAILWLYFDTRNPEQIIVLSRNIFWLVLPSLGFFLFLPLLLRQQMNFFLALLLSLAVTVGLYWLTIFLLQKSGMHL